MAVRKTALHVVFVIASTCQPGCNPDGTNTLVDMCGFFGVDLESMFFLMLTLIQWFSTGSAREPYLK